MTVLINFYAASVSLRVICADPWLPAQASTSFDSVLTMAAEMVSLSIPANMPHVAALLELAADPQVPESFLILVREFLFKNRLATNVLQLAREEVTSLSLPLLMQLQPVRASLCSFLGIRSLRALACASIGVNADLRVFLYDLRRGPLPCEVLDELNKPGKLIKPVGQDPETSVGGLHPGPVCVMTCAQGKVRSIDMVGLAAGCGRQGAIDFLKVWRHKGDDVLGSKAAGSSVPLMQRDSGQLVNRLIKLAMSRSEAEPPMTLIFHGWAADQLHQLRLRFWLMANTAKLRSTSQAGPIGTCVFDDYDVKHTEGEPGKDVRSNMMTATYVGENTGRWLLRQGGEGGEIVRVVHYCILGHGGGSGAGQHEANCASDALGFARAVVADFIQPDITIDIDEDGKFLQPGGGGGGGRSRGGRGGRGRGRGGRGRGRQ